MRKLFSHTTALMAGIVLAGLGTAVSAWIGPQNTPPTCVAGQAGCDAPINVGTSNQVKNGGLSVNALTVLGDSYTSGNFGFGIMPRARVDVLGDILFESVNTIVPGRLYTSVSDEPTNYDEELALTLGKSGGPYGDSRSSIYIGTSPLGGSVGRIQFNSDIVDATVNKFGIGTSSPAQKLSVAGKIYSSTGGFQFPDGSVQTTAAGGVSAVTTASCTTNSVAGIGFTCTVSCPASYYRSGCSGYSGGVSGITSAPSGASACICSSANNGNTCYAYCVK